MTKEEIRFQVALSCIQGVLEAKHGIIGEIVPEVAVKEAFRLADEFVKQWFKEEEKKDKEMFNAYMSGWNESRENILKHSIDGIVRKAGNEAIVKEKNMAELNSTLSDFNDNEPVKIVILKTLKNADEE